MREGRKEGWKKERKEGGREAFNLFFLLNYFGRNLSGKSCWGSKMYSKLLFITDLFEVSVEVLVLIF